MGHRQPLGIGPSGSTHPSVTGGDGSRAVRSKMNMSLEEMPLTQLSVLLKKSNFGLHLRKLALLHWSQRDSWKCCNLKNWRSMICVELAKVINLGN